MSRGNKLDHRSFIEIIEKEFYSEQQDFGRGKFYQSLPLLGIEGQRPTDLRIKEYGLEDILKETYRVLDIGCNCGFLDMSIAHAVKSVTGIEYNATLVKIANLTADYLNIANVHFFAADFNQWESSEEKAYDVIFSFAVHYWLKVTPKSYVKRLYDFLNYGGYIFFESQNINTVDKEFNEYCEEFISLGMSVEKEGFIKDDGSIERKYYILKKRNKAYKKQHRM